MSDRAVSKEKLGKALSTGEDAIKPGMNLKSLLRTDTIRRRFEDVLGKKAPAFISSIISVQASNKNLQTCDPMSIISAAVIAAALDLPIIPSLGFSFIVPYGNVAQFQIGWKGFVQLAMRSGQYLTMNVSEVHEGQLVKNDPFTGRMEFDAAKKKSDKIIGYVSYFKLLNGYEKYHYMTSEEVTAHGRQYSQSFKKGYGLWVDNFKAQALKTAIKLNLSKWGILSTEMQIALKTDQAVITPDGEPEYVDTTSEAAEPKDEPKAPAAKEVEAGEATKQETDNETASGVLEAVVSIGGVRKTGKADKPTTVAVSDGDEIKFLTQDPAITQFINENAGKGKVKFLFEIIGKDRWIVEAAKA